ncbi:hypothetical protein [Saccharopolyspora sp. SCSIO 74807]|uniref:hypothetical protein n=1 Tax=Saccharopolyspora sp. SCSIO 74807 TaxID=3118084 RepID=UPI0030CD9A3B
MPQVAPKPDPTTGEPRPPRAPVLKEDHHEKSRVDPTKANYPPAPEGEGPVLEWYQSSARDFFLMGVYASIALLLFAILRDWGFGWMSTWWMWLIILAPIPVFSLVVRFQQRVGISAGAEWFASDRTTYVRVYELAEVKLEGTYGGWDLSLEDRVGGRALVNLRDVQWDRDLWDLVYNGIVYSVQQGAKTNARADSMFR